MENNLDKYFRDNLHDRKFEPTEADWLGAEKLLEANEQRRKNRGMFWWFFSGTLMLLLLPFGLWFFWGNEAAKTPETTIETTGQTASTGSEASPVLEEKSSVKTYGQSAKNGEEATATSSIPKGQNDGTATQSVSSTSEQSNNKTIKQSSNNSISNKQKNAANLFKNSAELSENNAVKKPNSSLATESISTPSIESKNTEKEQQNQMIPPAEMIVENDLERISTPDLLAILTSLVRGNFPKKSLATTTQKIEVEKAKKLHLALVASQQFQPAPDKGEKTLLGQRIGLLLRKDIRAGWYISSGLMYQHRSGTFDASKSATQRNYRFGLELDTLLLRPTSLHYASLPLFLGFERNRHQFETGLLLDFLTGVRGETGSYQKQGEPPVKVFEAEKTGWVTTDGYRRFVPTAQLGYHYQLARRWSLGLTANYSIGGILDKGFEPPAGSFLLKEAEKFHLGAQVVYRIN